MKINLCTENEEKIQELDAQIKEADKNNKQKVASKTVLWKKSAVSDLQQCLRTPFLATEVTFYLEQLWTFNFTFYDCDINQVFFIISGMWQ